MTHIVHVSRSPLKKTFNLTLFPDAFPTQKTPATAPLASVSSNAVSTLAGSSVPAIRFPVHFPLIGIFHSYFWGVAKING
jgi:hypothetical protein